MLVWPVTSHENGALNAVDDVGICMCGSLNIFVSTLMLPNNNLSGAGKHSSIIELPGRP